MIKQDKGNTGQSNLGLSEESDPILGGVGRAEYGSIDWSDMQVANLERTQEYESESYGSADVGISDDERLELNVLAAAEKVAAREKHESIQYSQELSDALSRQKVADAAYEQEELSRMAESERIQNEFKGPTLRERVGYAVNSGRDWLGM